jgi:hypothetical protein
MLLGMCQHCGKPKDQHKVLGDMYRDTEEEGGESEEDQAEVHCSICEVLSLTVAVGGGKDQLGAYYCKVCWEKQEQEDDTDTDNADMILSYDSRHLATTGHGLSVINGELEKKSIAIYKEQSKEQRRKDPQSLVWIFLGLCLVQMEHRQSFCFYELQQGKLF